MSGGGGHIILGDKPLVDQIEENINLVSPFRRKHAQNLIAQYRANENSVTRADQHYLLRCASDIVDQ